MRASDPRHCYLRLNLGCLKRALDFMLVGCLACLVIILLLAGSHLLFDWCPLSLKGWDDEMEEVPICYALPSFEGLRDQRVVFAPEGPVRLFSAACPYCRIFPARWSTGIDYDPVEIAGQLVKLGLPVDDYRRVLRRQNQLTAAGDAFTCCSRFREFILLGSEFHGLLIYDRQRHRFSPASGPIPRGDLGETIKSIEPGARDFAVVADYLCPTFWATFRCTLDPETITCRRTK